jgi:hypothetical protein
MSKSVNSLQDECELVRTAIATRELAIEVELTKMRAILRECGADEKKRERRKAELQRNLREKRRLESEREHLVQQLQQLQAAVIEASAEAKAAAEARAVAAAAVVRF